jgi:hypothetical protein
MSIVSLLQLSPKNVALAQIENATTNAYSLIFLYPIGSFPRQRYQKWQSMILELAYG